MAVEVVESRMVKPSEATPKHRLWLSNLDHLMPRSHMTMVFFYRPSADPASSSPHVLKAALSKALVPFYPLAGRLAADGTGRLEISCTGDGARLVIARSDARLDEMGDLAPSDELRRMLVPLAEGGGGGGDHAGVVLAMFQVTFFSCGSVCLGAAIYRAAADGRAFGNFLRAWAAMARGVGEAEAAVPRPWLDRTLLRARSPPSVRFDHAVAVTSHRDGAGRSNRKVPFDTAILPISRDQVDALKASAGTTAAGKKVSTFNAVVAHVWGCACKSSSSRGAAAGTEDDTRVYMTADARSRVRPPLPDGYLGNAVVRALAVAKVSDIVSGSLATAAARVSDATARLSDKFVRSLVDYAEQARSGAAAEWPVIPETDLWIVSWQGLPFSELDFGWGRPAFVGPATITLGGRVYLVPSPDGGGGVDVVVAMEPGRLARFRELFYEGLRRCSAISQIHDTDRREETTPSKL